MEPYEVMTSESQERMLAIVTPHDLDEVLAICERWEVRASVIGRVTAGPEEGDGRGRLRIMAGFDGEVLADVPAASLHEDAPLYEREMAPPVDLEQRRAATAASLPVPDDHGRAMLDLLMDTSWVWRQYDHQLFLNTVAGPGGNATVLRLKHPTTGADTGRGLALTTDGNHRWCALDPRAGTAMVVAESYLNLAVVGARPVALVNCLNFGNPEHAEVMWQFSETVDGMSEACRAFGVPVVGGNVSFYNESGGADIDPTPIMGVLGVIDSLERRPPGAGLVEGGRLVLLGSTEAELSGSAWAWAQGHRTGRLPGLDLELHTRLTRLVRDLVSGGMVAGLHDVSTGGLGVALSEMAVASGVGYQAARVPDHAALFSESPSRVVLCVAPDDLPAVMNMAEAAGVLATRIGLAAGDRCSVKDLYDLPLADVVSAWRDRLPTALGAGTTQG
jgi:phosphoribosylformylglycinamidine synthase